MIKIQYTEPNGVNGIINHLDGHNAELSAVTSVEHTAKKAKLMNRAIKMAGDWGKVFPETKFSVIEV